RRCRVIATASWAQRPWHDGFSTSTYRQQIVQRFQLWQAVTGNDGSINVQHRWEHVFAWLMSVCACSPLSTSMTDVIAKAFIPVGVIRQIAAYPLTTLFHQIVKSQIRQHLYIPQNEFSIHHQWWRF